jgi:dTDP-4-dehydrorhamnose 3,5-epimerase
MPPFTGPQLLRCIRGAIYAVIVDLRPDSPTKLEWEGFDLSERNCRLLYIPVGFGLGFQTRIDDTEVIQQLAHPSAEEAMTGLRYDDPLIAIRWPEPVMETSPQDASWPPLRSRDASIALHSA